MVQLFKNIGDGSAFSAGGGGAGWNGIPWDPKNDGVAVVTASYAQANNRSLHTFTNGGVWVGIEGEAADAGFNDKIEITLPTAGVRNFGYKRNYFDYNFALRLGSLWFPAGTTATIKQYSRNVVERYIDADYASCAKLVPGLINMGDYDHATNLKSFSWSSGYIISSAANPNGCTVLWAGASPSIDDQTPANSSTMATQMSMEVRDSGGTIVTNGMIIENPGANHNSGGDMIQNFQFPFPMTLDAGEQLWGAAGIQNYVIAYDPDGWV
jgi:hypothetical protein